MASILIVEDDTCIRTLIKIRLTLHGHQVTEAENGKIGIETALAEDFDAILMDMYMPVLDGHHATKKLRTLGYKKLIIAVTASDTSQESQLAISCGCDYIITKPINENFEKSIDTFIIQANKNNL